MLNWALLAKGAIRAHLQASRQGAGQVMTAITLTDLTDLSSNRREPPSTAGHCNQSANAGVHNASQQAVLGDHVGEQ